MSQCIGFDNHKTPCCTEIVSLDRNDLKNPPEDVGMITE